MGFHVGQKVVCVHSGDKFTICDRISLWWYGVVRCPKGFIGTVCNVYLALDGDEMIELTELPSPKAGPWIDGFRASCFRPLVERATDISIFTALLDTTKHKERV